MSFSLYGSISDIAVDVIMAHRAAKANSKEKEKEDTRAAEKSEEGDGEGLVHGQKGREEADNPEFSGHMVILKGSSGGRT